MVQAGNAMGTAEATIKCHFSQPRRRLLQPENQRAATAARDQPRGVVQ